MSRTSDRQLKVLAECDAAIRRRGNAGAALREAFRFHLEHGGYSVPPGRAACALASARAELRLRELQAEDRATVEWIMDDAPYDPGDVCTEEEAAQKFERGEWTGPYGCIVRIDAEEDSLWGIVFGPQDLNDPYRRVVEAELADTALDALDREAAESTRAARMDVATVAR